ncbi:hypothetical protein [Sinorhizobium fredii]|uniref:hypothetical protein n=1 Tax=Rhizobium fredii TaxID=380 RepID=UPI0035184CEB
MENGHQQTSAHLFGFPDEWFYQEQHGGLVSGGVRAFVPPDPSKLPDPVLKNHALFKRLLLSVRDLAHASSAATFMRQDIDFDEPYSRAELRRFMCYETTLIVSYARPFSQSNGELPALTYRSMGIKLSAFTRRLHEDLIQKRNQIFAHADPEAVLHSRPAVMKFRDASGRSFSVLNPPTFMEGTMLDRNQFEQASVLVSCLSLAVYEMANAMHPHFADQYPHWELDSNGQPVTVT